MKCNHLIGTIDREKSVYKQVLDEKFLLSSFTTKGLTVPVVFSEYVQGIATGKVEVTGYIRSETYNDKLFTFLYVVDIRSADDTEEDTNEIEISGEIVHVKEMVPTARGNGILPLTIRYGTGDGNITVVHTTVSGGLARRLRGEGISPRDKIECKGNIKQNGLRVTVVLTEATIEASKRRGGEKNA